jgi:hypothetical protein
MNCVVSYIFSKQKSKQKFRRLCCLIKMCFFAFFVWLFICYFLQSHSHHATVPAAGARNRAPVRSRPVVVDEHDYKRRADPFRVVHIRRRPTVGGLERFFRRTSPREGHTSSREGVLVDLPWSEVLRSQQQAVAADKRSAQRWFTS